MRTASIILISLLISSCGLLRSSKVQVERSNQIDTVNERIRDLIFSEDIVITFPTPITIPNPAARPSTGEYNETITAPAGTVVTIRRELREKEQERTDTKEQAVERIDEEKVTEVESGISWPLIAFFAGLAGALALVVFIIIRYRVL